MYSLLEDADTFGFANIISWQPGGKSFKLHKLEVFETTIMQSYFTQTKLKSFQRQLNIYGWKKVQVGANKGGYYHKSFVRGSPELCGNVVRRKFKDSSDETVVKRAPVFDSLINSMIGDSCLSSIEPRPILPQHEKMLNAAASWNKQSAMQLEDSEVETFYDFFYPEEPKEKSFIETFFTEDGPSREQVVSSQQASSWHAIDEDFSLQVCNNDLDDFVNILKDDAQSAASSSQESEKEGDLETDNSFPYKVHLMLENSKRDNYTHVVSWVKNGTAFKVHNTKEFVERILPMYFDQTKYESFRRQLNLYQFARVARGSERGIISHPCLLEGARWLCDEIKRARKEQTVSYPFAATTA